MELVPIPKDIAFAQAEWDEIGAWGRATRINAAVVVSGMAQTDLAERLGLSQNTIGSWIFGDKDADWSRWISISNVLGLGELWRPTDQQRKAAEARLAMMRPELRSAPPQPVRRTLRPREAPVKKRARP